MSGRYLTTREAAAYLATRMPDAPTTETLKSWARPSVGRRSGPRPEFHKSASGRVWWSTVELDRWAAAMPADWKGTKASPNARPAHP